MGTAADIGGVETRARERPWRSLLISVHLMVMGLWFGTIVTASGFAAMVFPAMKRLDPFLPGYAEFTGEHWLLAAGHIAENVFLAADIVQLPCAVIGMGSFALLTLYGGLSLRRPSVLIRSLAIGVAVASLAGMLLIVTPQMNASIQAYRSAAVGGEIETAMVHKARFDELHPIASALMMSIAASVFVAFWLATRSVAKAEAMVDLEREFSVSSRRARYEEPRLARAGR